jgi:LytS/YehU family sensor histidine kinase
MNAKNIAFIIMMGALGTALFGVTYYLGPIAPGVNLDFSLIAVFIAGFFGGPVIGFVSGLFVGIFPGIMFGPLGMGGALGLIGLPLGKALSGFTAGFIVKGLKIGQKPRTSLITVPATFLAYVPESIMTYVYFIVVLGSQAGAATFFTAILPKAIVEVAIISVIMAALVGNTGFKDFVTAHFTGMKTKEKTLPQP